MIASSAHLRYLKITPRKARAVVDTIRGCSVNEAEARLTVSPQRSGTAILKLLRSAVANARQNPKIDPAKLVIHSIRVDQGPKVGRWTPRARGSGALIERKSCHISIELSESPSARPPRYTITRAVPALSKSERGAAAAKRKRPEPPADARSEHGVPGVAPKPQQSFAQRIFRRKVI